MKREVELKQKMKDYDIFGKVLLAVAAMLLLGTVVAAEGKSNAQMGIIIISVLFSIGGAGVCFRQSIKMQKKYYEG